MWRGGDATLALAFGIERGAVLRFQNDVSSNLAMNTTRAVWISRAIALTLTGYFLSESAALARPASVVDTDNPELRAQAESSVPMTRRQVRNFLEDLAELVNEIFATADRDASQVETLIGYYLPEARIGFYYTNFEVGQDNLSCYSREDYRQLILELVEEFPPTGQTYRSIYYIDEIEINETENTATVIGTIEETLARDGEPTLTLIQTWRVELQAIAGEIAIASELSSGDRDLDNLPSCQ